MKAQQRKIYSFLLLKILYSSVTGAPSAGGSFFAGSSVVASYLGTSSSPFKNNV